MVSTRGLKVDFTPGECVLCFEPDLSKARVLYDAKVCDIVSNKNRQGNRRVEYMVHFQGWNSSWDRVVPASFVVKNTDRNRKLMRKLAEVARRVKKNRSRMRRIDNILKDHFQERPKFDSDTSISDSSDETGEDEMAGNGTEEDSDTLTEDEEANRFSRNGTGKLESDSEEEKDVIPLECTEPKEVVLDLPGNLRRKLEQDCIMIQRKEKLISLPAQPNIITILEGYVKNFGVNILCATVEKQKPYTLREQRVELPEKNIDLCKEMMDGIRIFFDFALPTILLYGAEREQYERLQATTKPLVKLTKEIEDRKSPLQSPKLSKSVVSSSEPPAKVARFSPRTVKKEPPDVSDDDFGPPRRITRKAFQEEIRKSSLKNSDSAKKSKEKESHDISEPTPEKRRNSSGPKSDNKSPGKVLRSGKKSEKPPEKPSGKRERSSRSLSERVTPPPPLLLPGSMSSSSSTAETPTSSVEQSLFQHGEAAVNEIFSWKMLPDSEYERVPDSPSLIYGAHHLLRLFVKLPDTMEKMPIPTARLKIMVKHLEQFIQYLSTHAEEFFPDSMYVEADETFGWKDL